MKIQIFVRIAEKKRLIIIDEDALVADIIGEIKNKYLNKSELDQIEFSYEDKTLNHSNGKTFKELNIRQGSTLAMIALVNGGTPPESCIISKDKSLTSLPGIFQVTTSKDKPDIITYEDGLIPVRAIMPCGHAISPGSMTRYCEALLEDNKHQIVCPSCSVLWPWHIVKHVSCFSKDEWSAIEMKISRLALLKSPLHQQCPGCQMWLRRNETVEMVNCWNCTSKDGKTFNFCWNCLFVTNANINFCVKKCSGNKERANILRNCPMKKIDNEECPSVRSCPLCKFLINHIGGCKHMKCTLCGCDFCFVCLKYAQIGKPYDDHRATKCSLAPN